jgi:hypothetical protein
MLTRAEGHPSHEAELQAGEITINYEKVIASPANGTIYREISIISKVYDLADEKLQRVIFFGQNHLREVARDRASRPKKSITPY